MKVGTAGMKTGTTQQIRQLTLHQQLLASQRKIPSQKVTQLGQVMVSSVFIKLCFIKNNCIH